MWILTKVGAAIHGSNGGELVGVALPRVHGVEGKVRLPTGILCQKEAEPIERRRVRHRVFRDLEQGLLKIMTKLVFEQGLRKKNDDQKRATKWPLNTVFKRKEVLKFLRILA